MVQKLNESHDVWEILRQERARFQQHVRDDMERRLSEYDAALRAAMAFHVSTGSSSSSMPIDAMGTPNSMVHSAPRPAVLGHFGPKFAGPESTHQTSDYNPPSETPHHPGEHDQVRKQNLLPASRGGDSAVIDRDADASVGKLELENVEGVAGSNPNISQECDSHVDIHESEFVRMFRAAKARVLHDPVSPRMSQTDDTDVVERRTKRGRALLRGARAHSHFAGRVLDNAWFEIIAGIFIMLNVFVMALELQYKGINAGHFLKMDGYDTSGEAAYPFANEAFEKLEIVFNLIFFVELLIRLAAHGSESIKNVWMWIDALLVLFSILQTLGSTTVDPSVMRLIRLLRLLRLVRMVRTFGAFDALFLIIRALQLSGGSFIWSFVVLFMMELGIGMVMSQIVHPIIWDESMPMTERTQLFIYFGTWSHTMLTMMEITIGNFIPVCRLLGSTISEWWTFFFILYRGMFVFCTVKVISAVFIAQLNKAISNDDALAINRHKDAKNAFKTKLEDMFTELDHDGDGFLTEKEFVMLKNDETIREWGAALGINTDDIEELWTLLAGGGDKVERECFFHGISNWAGGATAKDIVRVLGKISHMLKKMQEHHEEGSMHRQQILVKLHRSGIGI